MTITVVTAHRGDFDFDANDWNTIDGELWVGDGDTQEGVAQFAPGAWLFVYETSEDKTPRVWDSYDDIPEGIVVEDEDGDYWKLIEGEWNIRYISSYNDPSAAPDFSADYFIDSVSGPFKEVLQ